MIGAERSLGLELTANGWRAVHLEARLGGVCILGAVAGELLDRGDLARSASGALEACLGSFEVAPGTRLGLAVARPIAQLKRLELPRASRAQIREAIRKQAASVLPVGDRAMLADYRQPRRNGRRREGALGLVAAAPEDLIEAVAGHAQARGLEFASADLSACAIRRLLPRGVRSAILSSGSGVEWVEYDSSGQVECSRFFPAGGGNGVRALPDDVAAALGEQRVMWVGPEAEAGYPEAGGAPWSDSESLECVRRTAPGLRALVFAPAYGAALEAVGVRPLFDLRPERLQQRETAAGRRRTAWLASAVVTAAIVYWLAGVLGLRSEVAALEREAEVLQPQVEVILEMREQIDEAVVLAGELAGLEAEQPRWTAVLAELAVALPMDSYVTAVSQQNGSLRVEGYTESASRFVEALERSQVFESARLAGPVSWENVAGTERERFTVEITLLGGWR
jgi:Tfp pilus assembly protein PilN